MNDVWLGSLLVLGTVLFYLSMPQQNWRAVPLNRIPARLGAAVCLWLALRLALVDRGAGAAFAICMVTAMMAWISYPLLGCLVHRLLKRALCP